MSTSLILIICLLLGITCKAQKDFSNENIIEKQIIYKTIDTTNLILKIIYPQVIEKDKKYTTVVFFFGGSWKKRNIDQFLPHAQELSKIGIISVLADYRVENIHKTTPIECVKDARDAMRYIRLNAENLQIDTAKIIAAGGSAGGHLAAATACIDSFDNIEDKSIDITPKAIVLFNPVINNGPNGGYGYDRVKSYYKKFSPAHNIKRGMRATLFIIETKYQLIPIEMALDYQKQMVENGNRCDLYLYSDQKHSFFNYNKGKNPYYFTTLSAMISFIRDLDLLEK